MYTNTNFVYFFNENDFAGEDNSNANSNAVSAINLAYRKAFPTYDLPSQGIYQSFKYGSVLFLMTDSRTFLDTGKGFLFGTTQVNWLIEKLKAAANDTATSAVFITITQPWNYVEEAYDRDYIKQNFKSILQGVANEKTAVGETIRQNFNFNQPNSPNFKPVILIVGERALSFDDGSFNNFGSFPIVVCGPLDYWQQCRGGPYSHGSFHDSVGQYCVFDVYQHSVNNNTCVKMTGIISENEKREKDQPVFIYDTCAPHLYKARVNLKCPILWTEKIVAAAITIAVIFVVWIVFFVIIYRASVNALRFKHLKDA